MKSARLDPALERRLRRAAGITGKTLSAFVRRAAVERADKVPTADCGDEFGDVLGVIHGGGGRARHSGEAFTEIVAERRHKT